MREFYVGYWDKEYLDSQFPERQNTPYFQLNEGEIAVGRCISKPNNFSNIALDILRYLRQPNISLYHYQIKFSKDASAQLGKTEKQVLEEIVALHNDMVPSGRK